jgi:hypothetical protein
MGRLTRNRIKSYWNAATLVVEQASRISETQRIRAKPIVRGFPFFGLLAAQYTARNTLALQWQGSQVRMQGPRARDFYTAFAKGSATGIEANGADILSVQLIQPPAPPCPLAATALIMTPDRRRTGRNSFALTLAIVIGSGTLTTAGR